MKTACISEDAKYLQVSVYISYWGDAIVDGVVDKKGLLIPCRINNIWYPRINITTGHIVNWKQGHTANICYKIYDGGRYVLIDKEYNEIATYTSSRVPYCLHPKHKEHDAFIIMYVTTYGIIVDWNGNIDDLIGIKDDNN